MPRLTRVALGKNEDGRLEVVATSRDDGSSDTVWHAWQKPTPGSEWTGWHQFGKPGFGKPGRGDLLNRPTTIQHARDGRLQLFTPELNHYGAARALWHRYQTAPMSEDWSDWKSLGKPGGRHQPGPPVVIDSVDGRLVLLTVAEDGAVWHRSQQTARNLDSWTPWASLGRKENGFWEVGVAMDATGRLILVATTQSNLLWHTAQSSPDDMTWVPWAPLSTVPVPLADPTDPTLRDPTLRLNHDGRTELFVTTAEGNRA
jgi:hypothetical protein